MKTTPQLIHVGQIEIRFLLESADTGGALAMFEFIVPPNARVPIPHSHVSYDETIYGVSGVVAFTVEGRRSEIGPGDILFIPRGAVHGFVNPGSVESKSLALITPAALSSTFFREMAGILGAGGPPDPRKLGEVMLRHGLKPAPPA